MHREGAKSYFDGIDWLGAFLLDRIYRMDGMLHEGIFRVANDIIDFGAIYGTE